MNLLHEWPLVLFTLSVQAAVGLQLALLTAAAFHGRGDAAVYHGPWGRRPSLLVGVLMAVGLAFSVLHLGAPLNALHTLANLDQSWLSREILAALLFLGLWGVGFWLGRRPGPTVWPRMAPALVTGMAGIALVWVMARIYMVPARPLWDHWLTAVGFFLTALLLGITILLAHTRVRRDDSQDPASFPLAGPVLISAGIAAAVAQLAVTLAHPVTRELMALSDGTPLVAVRLLLLLGGALCLAMLLLRRTRREGVSPTMVRPGLWPGSALLILVASEIVGRMLFYAVGSEIPF